MISLIEILAKRKEIDLYFEERELLQIINSLSNDWDIKKQVETFVWWNTRYRKSIPNLLKTQEDKWLKYQEECYFLIGDFDEKGLPSWVKIPALHKEYQQELFNMAEGVQEVIRNHKSHVLFVKIIYFLQLILNTEIVAISYQQ